MGSAQDEVGRVVAAEAGRLRKASAGTVLVLLGAAALTPIAIAMAGGGPVPVAVAGVAGNVGSSYLTSVVERVAGRIRRRGPARPDSEVVRREFEVELMSMVKHQDEQSREVSTDLLVLLDEVGGLSAALRAADSELREHLQLRLGELADQQRRVTEQLTRVTAEQRRQGKELHRQGDAVAEMLDRLRVLGRRDPVDTPTGRGVDPVRRPAETVVVVAPAGLGKSVGWQGGARVEVGDHVYLLQGELLAEQFSPDHTVVRRQARALRMPPTGRAGSEYVWLRQVAATVDGAPAREAVREPAQERDLMTSMGRSALLTVSRHVAARGVATLVLRWPLSRSTGGPAETLAAWVRDGTSLDGWRRHLLLTGLPHLCETLALLHDQGVSHRCLAPAAVLVRDQRLLLRDVGAAARGRAVDPPVDYAAPEQHLGGLRRIGAPVDVYQTAALAYHLLTGRPPHARIPPYRWGPRSWDCPLGSGRA